MDFNYAKLRAARRERRMTIQDLAEAAQVSPSLISQIERGKVVPTLTVFWRICKALDIPMHVFFETDSAEQYVLRREHRRILQFPDSHVRYFLLSPQVKGSIEFLLVEIDPGETHDPEGVVSHAGEEYGYILRGEMIVRLGSEDIHLRQGDSIAFPSSIPHRYRNPGSEVCQSIWAMTPPSF